MERRKAGWAQVLNNERGFTLTEMLIVVALIGAIMAFVGSNLIDKFVGAKVDTTKIQMRQVGSSLDQFRLDCGFYPETDQGLDALVEKPAGGRECKNYDTAGYVRDGKLPKDGFDNDFLYESDGRTYTLISLGNDGKEGGDGHDADVSSKDL